MFTPILAGLKRGMGETFTNASHIVALALFSALIAIVFFHVWYNVVDDPRRVLAYVALTEALWMAGGPKVARIVEYEYNAGLLDSRLLRPLPLWLQYLSEILGPGIIMYTVLFALINAVLYAYMGIVINPVLGILAFPLHALATTLVYYVLGTFVVDMGRVRIFEWILGKVDLMFMVIPREIIGNGPYLVVPSAYIYYWPAMLALKGSVPPFWFLWAAIMILVAILAERRMIRKIEVFGG